MSRCIAFTRDGDQCERDNLNDKIPYCWQHARQRLEKTLWGSDQVEDSGDDLTPEEVYAIVMAAIRNSNPNYDSSSVTIINENEINIDIGSAVPPSGCSNPEHDDLRDRVNELNYLYAQLHDEHQNCISEKQHLSDELDRYTNLYNGLSGEYELLKDEHNGCSADKEALQSSIDSLSSSLQETTAALTECRSNLADCQESETVHDNGGTGAGDLPGVVTEEEEESPDDSGTFWSGVLDLPDINPVLTIQQCPEKITESDLSHLKPENSVGMFVCSDDNIRHSGDYLQNVGKDVMYADLASASSNNDLSTYFSTAPGMYNAWDKQMAIGSWVKPGDWFFFKGADGFWYGNVIESATYSQGITTGTQQLGYTHIPERTVLKFEKEYPFTNLGEGVPFAIIIFNPET